MAKNSLIYLNKIILAFLEPVLLLSGKKKLLFQRFFLLLVLKCQKLNCFILKSQKIKCLVLSRYPRSGPCRARKADTPIFQQTGSVGSVRGTVSQHKLTAVLTAFTIFRPSPVCIFQPTKLT